MPARIPLRVYSGYILKLDRNTIHVFYFLEYFGISERGWGRNPTGEERVVDGIPKVAGTGRN